MAGALWAAPMHDTLTRSALRPATVVRSVSADLRIVGEPDFDLCGTLVCGRADRRTLGRFSRSGLIIDIQVPGTEVGCAN